MGGEAGGVGKRVLDLEEVDENEESLPAEVLRDLLERLLVLVGVRFSLSESSSSSFWTLYMDSSKESSTSVLILRFLGGLARRVGL